MRQLLAICALWLLTAPSLQAQQGAADILPGAARFSEYLPMLQGKRVGVFSNQTSLVGRSNTVDTLLKRGIHIVKIFGPEHGFRGTASAGASVDTYTDSATGILVVSLYGKKNRPTDADLADVDVLVFDIQDIGVRFYTYQSSLEYFMESAFQHHKPLIVLDRPNPNGFYVDGPVLDTAFRSGIGRMPVPVVYGMTIGEYGRMLAGEHWLKNDQPSADALTVIPCGGYTHKSLYQLPVAPSPNIRDMAAVYLYPSTCFFEGTVLSEGRGTPHPFAIFGHPSLPHNLFSFTPQPDAGSDNPKLKAQLCYGWNVQRSPDSLLRHLNGKLHLHWLLDAYRLFPEKDSFFIIPKDGDMRKSFFDKLAGNDEFRQQIKAGTQEAAIRAGWQPALDRFKAIRRKYLLYEDF